MKDATGTTGDLPNPHACLMDFLEGERAKAYREALEEAAGVADRFAAQAPDRFEAAAARDIAAGIRSLDREGRQPAEGPRR